MARRSRSDNCLELPAWLRADLRELFGAKRLIGLLALAALLSGCLRQDYPPDAKVVSDVSLEGAEVVSAKKVLAGLATAKSARFLGIWDGVIFEYEVFDETVLTRDLERIERFYRARGYYEAKVTAARVIRVDAHRVRVELRVHEGIPVTLSEIQITGLRSLEFEVEADAYTAATLRIGEPLDEDTYEASKRAIVTTLANAGYAFAKVTGKVDVDISRHAAKVALHVEPGSHAVYGPIGILGLRKVPEDKIRQNLKLLPGDPYSEAELKDARRALLNLGVFTSVKISADRSKPASGVVPITVIVEEGALRTLRIGGGVRIDAQQTSTHLTGGWEHKNFLGGLRHLALDARPGFVLYPTRTNNIEPPNRLLFQNEVRTRFQQPSFLEGRTTGALAGGLNVFPLLYAESTATDPIVGYVHPDASAGLERAFFNHHLYVTPSYNWQAFFPFDYDTLTLGEKVGIERENGLITVIASYPELLLNLDLRDDQVEPTQGAMFSTAIQLANASLGGTVSDVRLRPEARGYYELAPGWVLASRVTLGFLVPNNYATSVDSEGREDALLAECATETSAPGEDPNPALDACRLLAEDEQKLLVRGFFSGGPNSNRGYAVRGVGPHRALGFLSRGSVDCTQPEYRDARACLRPIGGLTLWEASLELRFPLGISDSLRAATFVDASDVTRGLFELRSNAPHLSVGIGFRYRTPVGPLRIDFGYRIPGLQAPGIDDGSTLEDGDPSEFLGLVPATLNIALGEAF